MNNIDVELIAKLSSEISDRYKKIVNLFPDGNSEILKHLAASSIHMALFMQAFYDIHKGIKTKMDDKTINKFLEECGCNFKK